MNDHLPNTTRPNVTRRALLLTGFVLALAIGAPWLLNDAPPSPEAVVAAKACCTKAPAAKTPAYAAPGALPAR